MIGLPPERLEYHLWNWERWMESATVPGQLKASSAERLYVSSGWDLDADYEEMDRQAGVAVQAAIDGLESRLRIAVYVEHGIMAAVYRLRDQPDAYADACVKLAISLYRRGLV